LEHHAAEDQDQLYTAKQQDIIHDIFKGLINPDWYTKFMKQLKDDTGNKPWGADNRSPFSASRRREVRICHHRPHHTLRADGNTEAHVAFGGPIFYGHAASGFNEKADHPGNVFWYQALEANKVYQMLDDKQRKRAEVSKSPKEAEVPFQGPKGQFPGFPVRECPMIKRNRCRKCSVR